MLEAIRPPSTAPPGPFRAALIWGGLALGSAAVPALALWLGLPLLPAIALTAIAGWVLLTGPMRWAPFLPLLLIPAPIAHVPVHEVGLVALCGTLVVIGLQRRAPWLTQLGTIEIAAGLLLAWALFTGLWCRDVLWFLFNARKMGIGLLGLWAASRLATRVTRADMLLGITLGAFGIACVTVGHAVAVGWLTSGHSLSRTTVTDIGWGTSNYITAILVLAAPSSLCVALREHRLVARILGWAVLPLVALVASMSGSRGGAILIVVMSLLLVGGARLKHRQLWLAVPLTLALLVVGPGASKLIARFTSPLEFSSVTLRLHYFDIGWHRLVDNLPWGMGLGQELLYPDELAGGDPHNYLLGMGSELGLPGLLLWGAVIVAIWRRSGAQLRAQGSTFEGMALRITLVIAVLNSLFEPTLFGLYYHFLFYWIVGAYLGSPPVPEPAAPAAASGWVAR